MSRPLRDTDPEKIHLITARTASAELLLVPHSELNSLIGGIIARYAEMYGIEIFAYCILSNHYHLLVRAPSENLMRFTECMNKEVAKRVNKLLFRKGVFWGRRYDDQVTIEETDALEGLLYVVTNPVKHGLVANPKDWPGLTCYWQIQDEQPRTYTFFLHTEYRKALIRSLATGEPIKRADFEKIHELKLTPLPLLSKFRRSQRTKKLIKLIQERTAELVSERKAKNLSFLGRRQVLRQPRKGMFPKNVSSSPRPRCYTKNAKALANFKREEKQREESYRQCSRKYRSGITNVEFPKFTVKPPTHQIPSPHSLAPP